MFSVSLVVLIVTLLKSSPWAWARPPAARTPKTTSRLVCFMARAIDPRSGPRACAAGNGLLPQGNPTGFAQASLAREPGSSPTALVSELAQPGLRLGPAWAQPGLGPK